MAKQFLRIIALVLMMVSFAGCGKSASSTPSAAIEPTMADMEPSATPTPTPAVGTVEEIFALTSIGSAHNGATTPTTFITTHPWQITEIQTYHWNKGNGVTPGTISLVAADGTSYGPWQARGLPGQGGVPNANWVVNPNVTIPAGSYSIIDSDPATWSQNAETNGAGMAWVSGIPQNNP